MLMPETVTQRKMAQLPHEHVADVNATQQTERLTERERERE